MQQKHQKNTLYIHKYKNRKKLIINLDDNHKDTSLKQLHSSLINDYTHRLNMEIPAKHPIAHVIKQARLHSKMYSSLDHSSKSSPLDFIVNYQQFRRKKEVEKDKRIKLKIDLMQNRRRSDFLSQKRSNDDSQKIFLLQKKPIYQNSQRELINLLFKERNNNKNSVLICKPKIKVRTKFSEQQSIHSSPRYKQLSERLLKKDYQNNQDFIRGYLKGKLLGKGGFSNIWQAINTTTKKYVIVKEIDITNKHRTYLNQIMFARYFFENGRVKASFISHKGINCILQLIDYQIINKQAFLVYQKCSDSLSHKLYDIFEEDNIVLQECNKLYLIRYRQLYQQLRLDSYYLKKMIYQISLALDLLSSNNIVHSDLKTQNILINVNHSKSKYDFKLIDYGSSFFFKNITQYHLATPQYMPPQILNFILHNNNKRFYSQILPFSKDYTNVSAIDIWGLGCVVIQIIHGLPIWLCNNTKIEIDGQFQTKKGLFAIENRQFYLIIRQQINLINNIHQFFNEQNNSRITIDQTLKQVIIGMLAINPQKRLRPHQIAAILESHV